MEQRPVCLTIGGSDSCGGAGIQADLRVFNALDILGCSAISALTAQNPDNILHIQGSSIEQFEAEINVVSDYYKIDCIKTGMLFDNAHLRVLTALKQSTLKKTPLIVDPVLIASSGKYLFQTDQAKTAYNDLIPLATLWTPNTQEASFFLEQNMSDPIETASALLLKYHVPVLLKGGHGEGNLLRDIFCNLDGSVEFFEHPKLDLTKSGAHGTGCRLASSIASFVAHGNGLSSAISKAHRWLQSDLIDNRNNHTQQ